MSGYIGHILSQKSRRLKTKEGRENFVLLKPCYEPYNLGRNSYLLKRLRNKWEGKPVPRYVVKRFEGGAEVYTDWPSVSHLSITDNFLAMLPLAGFLEGEGRSLSFRPFLTVAFKFIDKNLFNYNGALWNEERSIKISSIISSLLHNSGLIKDHFITRIVSPSMVHHDNGYLHVHTENEIDATMIAMVLLSHDLPIVKV
jgi:hypothetical protein